MSELTEVLANCIMELNCMEAYSMNLYVLKVYLDLTWFDGKIAMIPIVEIIEAVRTSKFRDAGTPIVTPVSLTAEEYLFQKTKPSGILDEINEKIA